MDLESFRSKYSDLTVTALPASGKNEEEKTNEEDFKMATQEDQKPRVEITRVSSGNGSVYGPPSTSTPLDGTSSSSASGPSSSTPGGPTKNRGGSAFGPADGSGSSLRTRSQQQTAAALAYATEYREVMAKLDYTKYMQAKLKQLSESQGQNIAGAAAKSVLTFENKLLADEEPKATIADTFDNLVSVVGKMKEVLNPTSMGVRTASDRLLYEIASARAVVKTGQKS